MFAPAGIGVREAQAFLAEHLGHPVDRVELVGEGAWSRCFGFTDGARDLVIRFGRYVDDFEKDARAASFSTSALPVPQVSEVGTAFAGFFAISTRAYGRPLESLDAEEWEATFPALLAALDAIRRIDVSEHSGYGGWDVHGEAHSASWREFLLSVDADDRSRRTYGWRRRLVDSPVGDATFRDGLTLLADLAGSLPNERYVVHGDLINANVLVESARITAVFDWGCSFYGDYLYDLAWLEFWSPWYPAIAATDVRRAARAHYSKIGLAVDDIDERVRCCMIHIGLDHLAYHAFTGQLDELVSVDARTRALL